MKSISQKLLAVVLFTLSFSSLASAEVITGDHRFSLAGGVIHINNPSETAFSLAAEYEYRLDPFYGVGAQAAYVFSSLAITQISAPAFFFHPLQGDWYISAAPVFYFASQMSTLVGARFTTRLPLNISILTLVPTFGVDVIKGGPNYIFGLAFGI